MSETILERMKAACTGKQAKHCEDCRGTVQVLDSDLDALKGMSKEAQKKALLDLASSGGSLGCGCAVSVSSSLDQDNRGTITCVGNDPTSVVAVKGNQI